MWSMRRRAASAEFFQSALARTPKNSVAGKILFKEINLADAEALLKTLIPCTYAPLADSALRAHSHLELEPFPPAHRISIHSLPLVAQTVVAEVDVFQHPVDAKGVGDRDGALGADLV